MIDIYVSDNWEGKVSQLLSSFEEDADREKHLDILADAFMDHLRRNNCEYGAWGVDSKRPFGNSNVVYDIADLLRIKMPEYKTENWYNTNDYLNGLYDDLGVFLRYKWLKLKNV